MTTRRLRLPAHGWVTLALDVAARQPPASLTGMKQALAGVITDDGARAPLEAGALVLADVNVVRATLIQLGAWPEEAVDVVCENCDAAFAVEPCRSLELGAYFDGDAEDRELDSPFPFDEELPIAPITVRGQPAETLRLRDVTLDDAAALHRACEAYQLRFTREVVRGMGIVSLGPEKEPGRIARALSRAADDALDVVLDRFDEAHYPPRLTASARCPQCGAVNGVEAPSMRELPSHGVARREEPLAGFPALLEFEALVEREAEALFPRLGVQNVALMVEAGTPDCDDGGVPLLGSYTPPEGGDGGFVAHGPEVRLYYRTFRSMFEDEPYDVRGEVSETLEHELTHHLSFLSGHDEEDDEERAQIVREARRAVGDTETLRRGARAARGELVDFLYRTWPIWLVVLLVTVLAAYANR